MLTRLHAPPKRRTPPEEDTPCPEELEALARARAAELEAWEARYTVKLVILAGALDIDGNAAAQIVADSCGRGRTFYESLDAILADEGIGEA